MKRVSKSIWHTLIKPNIRFWLFGPLLPFSSLVNFLVLLRSTTKYNNFSSGSNSSRRICATKVFLFSQITSRYSFTDKPLLTWALLGLGLFPHLFINKIHTFVCRLESSYLWIRNDEIIAKGNNLLINKPLQHTDAGVYTCIARNKHGNTSVNVNINVLCEYLIISSLLFVLFHHPLL